MSGQRAFTRRISKHHASEVRKTVSAVTEGKNPPRSSSVSTISSVTPLQETFDPVDYEDFLDIHIQEVDRDAMKSILRFPSDDMKVMQIPRPIIALDPIDLCENEGLDSHVSDCIRYYTKDWIYASREYIYYSTSVEGRASISADKWQHLDSCFPPEYEVDIDEETIVDDVDREMSSSRNSQISDTPRGSWASSVFDLRNSVGDPLMPLVLSRMSQDTIDANNKMTRNEKRQDSVFLLYPQQDDEDFIERRSYAEPPQQHFGHRLLVKCINLKLELEIEPIFASMALYDVKEKKKVSETFYFDMNSEPLKRMLGSHVPYQDVSTLSRACIFNVTYPSSDLFIVVRLEKVLQGDINEVLGPYMKDECNKEKLKSSAVTFCERLGKYRMPLAWTVINLADIVQGHPKDGFTEKESSSNSLDRKVNPSSMEELKRKGPASSLTRRGSLERRSMTEKRRSWSPDEFGSMLGSFRPVTLTVSTFFKQEVDKLRDEDLYKFLPELKRSSSQLKKKCLSGQLVLDISPVRDTPKYCLSPELSRLNPYPDDESEDIADHDDNDKCRPIKELIQLSPHPILEPNFSPRNLLLISPKDLNFSGRPGSARNIAVKVQFMNGEEENNACPYIFGRSSCPEFTTEAFTAVSYHNKCPDFYDEFKIKLPAALGDHHHIFFTFYHISCQKKAEEKTLEAPVGYTWLPIFRDGSLQTGEHCLPVMMEPPPNSYSYITADTQLPGTKWVDNHKGIFTVRVDAVSTIHAQDPYIDKFFLYVKMIEDKNIPARIGETKMEGELKKAMLDLEKSESEPLVRFMPIILDRLILLLVRPPVLSGQMANLAQTAFNAVGGIVSKVTKLLEEKNDQHGRNATLLTYVAYQATLPYPEAYPSPTQETGGPFPHVQRGVVDSMHYPTPQLPGSTPLGMSPSHRRSSSNPDLGLDPDVEVGTLINKGLDRTSSMRIGNEYANVSSLQRTSGRRLVHEELALQWVVSNGPGRENGLTNAWFFFELILKSMVEHLAQTRSFDAPRKFRFSQQFCDDVENLTNSITNDIIASVNKDSRNLKSIQNVNSSLAFFLLDALSVMDRGFVFGLIKNYCKQINGKALSIHDATYLINLKLDFVRIVCSHEHFVALNLPFSTPISGVSAPSSPCPSISSNNSQGSFISTVFSGDRSAFMSLSLPFCQQHFLVGILLSDLSSSLEINSPMIHGRSINTIRNILSSHDTDDRLDDVEARARVASLYLPLINIAIDALPLLFTFSCLKAPLYGNPKDDYESYHPHINQSVAMAIAGSSLYATRECEYDTLPGPPKCQLSSETTRNLLICLLWLLKNLDDLTLRAALSELSHQRLHQLMDVLYIATSCFEYMGFNISSSILTGMHKTAPFAVMPFNMASNHSASHSLPLNDNMGGDCKPPIPPPPPLPNHLSIKELGLQGKKAFVRGSLHLRSRVDMRSRLEETIMGQNSARLEMMQRRRAEKNPPSPTSGNVGIGSLSSAALAPGGEKLRWRKDTFPWKSNQGSMVQSMSSQDAEKQLNNEGDQDSQAEGFLTAEANMVILDALENIVQVVTQSDHLQGLLSVVFKVLLHALASNQSTNSLTNMFNTQRSLVAKFPSLLFDEETEQCADLCLQLLKHCSSCICNVRSNAAASLYLLMRHNFEIGNNFARVKMQVTMSLSSLVGTSHTFSEAFLRRSLRTILTYAEEDTDLLDTSFPEQVKDLVFNLHMILSDTVKMKEYQEDPEMLLDLMYRIARGYQNSPDLRLTWLANMAQKHSERGQHAEAAMCLVHSAALVSEYLYMLEDRTYLPIGAVTFSKISPNVLEESAVSDDVLSPEEEGICTGKYFTETGLVGLLEQASSSFYQACMFECITEVYKVLIPIAEENRDWKKLINIHSKVHDAFVKIDQLEGKRIFGTYFRVGFYGLKFGDLDGEEFIYKEPTLTKLPEISHRLEAFYSERFGEENFEIIKDSNTVDTGKLKPEKAYVQITYVEAYFDVHEEKERVTSFEKNYNIKRFIFATPFTADGRAHGDLHEQYKRKTILTTQHMFPYIKKRVQVVDRYSWVLTPIEVAIEDIQKKTRELTLAINQNPPDHKILQMVLQGCIGTTVNQGPMEMALVFLGDLADGRKQPDRMQNKLRLCFKDFSRRCFEALKKNKTLIGPEMRPYQKELEMNFHRFTERLSPMIALPTMSRPSSCAFTDYDYSFGGSSSSISTLVSERNGSSVSLILSGSDTAVSGSDESEVPVDDEFDDRQFVVFGQDLLESEV